AGGAEAASLLRSIGWGLVGGGDAAPSLLRSVGECLLARLGTEDGSCIKLNGGIRICTRRFEGDGGRGEIGFGEATWDLLLGNRWSIDREGGAFAWQICAHLLQKAHAIFAHARQITSDTTIITN